MRHSRFIPAEIAPRIAPTVSEPLPRRPREERQALAEKFLVGAVLIGFLLLHIIGAAILHSSAAGGSLHEVTSSQRQD
jgi:hypothetical protein